MKFQYPTQNKTISNATFGYLARIIDLLTPLIILPYLVRKLGVEGYGQITIFIIVLTPISIMIQSGFEAQGTVSLIKTSGKEILQLTFNKIFSGQLTLIFTILPLFAILSSTISTNHNWFFFSTTTSLYLILNALFPSWILIGLQRLKIYFFIVLLNKTCYLISVFWLIKEPSDFLLVPLINLFIAAVNLSFVLFFVSKKEKLHFKYLGITKSYLMIFESSKYFFSTIMPYALMSIFAVYISHNLNATDLGIFTLLMQLMSVINSFAQMTAIVYMKHASSSLKKLKKTLLYCFAFGICFALAMLIFGDLVIELFFTGEITNFRSALDILSLLIPILFINRVLFQCFILLNINVRSSLISFLVPILISSLMTLFARLELDLISAALMYSVFRLLEFTTLIVQTIFLRSENRFSTKSSILPENKEKK